MASKLHEYFIYGGGTKAEFRKVYPKLQFENHKIWKMMSILLLLVSILGVIYNVANRAELSKYFILNISIYGALFGAFLVGTILLFTVASANKPIILSWVVYSIGSLGLLAAVVSACIERSSGGFPIAFTFCIALGGFLYLDRPVKNYVLFGVSIIPYIITSLLSGEKGIKYLLPVIIIWALGLIISSYTNYRRIQNSYAMVRYERLGTTDSLTNVSNKNKYDDTVAKIQAELQVRDVDFAVVVFDVNRLKETNDTYGHNRGDELLIRAVELIKEVFKNSEIYRIGGDEFCCILKDEDYEHRASLITNFHNKVESIHNLATSLQRDTSVASGLATFDPGADTDYTMVFARADKNMYRNKQKLKADNKFTKVNPKPEEDEEME